MGLNPEALTIWMSDPGLFFQINGNRIVNKIMEADDEIHRSHSIDKANEQASKQRVAKERTCDNPYGFLTYFMVAN